MGKNKAKRNTRESSHNNHATKATVSQNSKVNFSEDRNTRENVACPKPDGQSQSKENENKRKVICEAQAFNEKCNQLEDTNESEVVSTRDHWEDFGDESNTKFPASSSNIDGENEDYSSKKDNRRNERKSHQVKNTNSKFTIKDIEGDLFDAPLEYALAHCVGSDFSMSAGIALEFRNNYSGVGNLLDQNVKVGGVAFLERKGRKIFYLVTKKKSSGKPTYETLTASLKELRKQMTEKEINKLAIPEIGAGLDLLDWDSVKECIIEVFSKTDVEIVVYHYRQMFDSNPQDKKYFTTLVKNKEMRMIDMEYNTARFYICPVNNDWSKEMKMLDEKYAILNDLLKTSRKLGETIRHEYRNEDCAYGLVCRQTQKHPISFEMLEQCMKHFKKHNKDDKYEFIGIDAFEEPDNDIIMTQVVNIIRNSAWSIREIWVCWSDDLKKNCPELNDENRRNFGARASGGFWGNSGTGVSGTRRNT